MDGYLPRRGHHGLGAGLQPAGRRPARRARPALPGAVLTTAGPPPGLRHLAAVALLAAGGLGYEIALTRLLSALLVSSWVGPVLAVALAGLGLGAAVAAARPRWRGPGAAHLAAFAAALLAALSLPVWMWAAAAGRPLLGLALPLLAYLGAGWAGAALFSWWPARSALLLRSDYGAAALAALATPLLLGWLGGLGGGAAAALLLGLAASCLAPRSAAASPGPAWSGATAVLGPALPGLLLLATLVGSLSLDPLLSSLNKPIASMLQRGAVLERSRWDATARTDLLLAPDGARYLFMDGGAGSLVPDPDPTRWSNDVAAFAFAMAPAQRAFLIGSGGGLEVAQARVNGVGDVTAAEVNPASVALVRALGGAAGSVYGPSTTVVVGDGRRALARSEGDYDVITLAHVVTGAAELRGAALTENLVYTVEAFQTYLSKLRPDGRLALKLYDELTLSRALTTAVAALMRSGIAADEAAAMGHLMAVLDTRGGQNVPLLVVRRSPFGLEEAVAAARVAEARGWALLMVPGLLLPPSLQGMADGSLDLEGLIAADPEVDIRPTLDERPYFFAFEPGLPRDVRRAGWLGLGAALALAAAGLAWGARRRDEAPAAPGSRWLAAASSRWLAAASLGAGFLLLELHALVFLQRSVGQPAWSLSLMLGAVLLGGAIGAAWTARSSSRDPRGPALAAASAVAAWALLAPLLSSALLPLPPVLAGGLMAGLLLLVAVPMGMPFPRLLAAWGSSGGVAAALAASGLAAVAAGAGGLWLSHALGSWGVAAAAVLAYTLAALLHPAQTRG